MLLTDLVMGGGGEEEERNVVEKNLGLIFT